MVINMNFKDSERMQRPERTCKDGTKLTEAQESTNERLCEMGTIQNVRIEFDKELEVGKSRMK